MLLQIPALLLQGLNHGGRWRQRASVLRQKEFVADVFLAHVLNLDSSDGLFLGRHYTRLFGGDDQSGLCNQWRLHGKNYVRRERFFSGLIRIRCAMRWKRIAVLFPGVAQSDQDVTDQRSECDYGGSCPKTYLCRVFRCLAPFDGWIWRVWIIKPRRLLPFQYATQASITTHSSTV